MSMQFTQVWANAGYDASPNPTLIVPRSGSNVIALVGGKDLSLVPSNKNIQIEELDPKVASQPNAFISMFGLDAAFKDKLSIEAALVVSGQRVFRISSKSVFGASGSMVDAVVTGTSKVQKKLRVIVLGKRVIKLAIRPVMVRDAQAAWVTHSQKPFDAKHLVAMMNKVWTPQSNVVFELVSSDPVQFDDEAAIAKALGSAEKMSLPKFVTFDVFAPMFKAKRHPDAALTIFLVERIGTAYPFTDGAGTRHQRDEVLGKTETQDAFALVADGGRGMGNGERTMSHEAGHWMGSFQGKAKWVSYGHAELDNNMLMSVGVGVKVTATATVGFFNKNYLGVTQLTVWGVKSRGERGSSGSPRG